MEPIRYSDDNRYTQDDTGQWWYRTPGRPHRKRASVRTCPECDGLFLSADSRTRTCSHPCGAAWMHSKRPVTTPPIPKAEIRNSDNPRYSLDDSGQWWYTPGGSKVHGRTRAYLKTCQECGSAYLVSIFHRKIAEHCSKTCGQRAWARAHPGHYKGAKASNWKGGRHTLKNGYVQVWQPDHPSRANTEKPYVLEHRLVMEKVLGRYLLPKEKVHHKNGIRDDNRPENLELWASAHPPGQRVHEQQHCPTCTCFKK